MDELARQFRVERFPLLEPRYNIAPTQPVAAVRRSESDGSREMVLLRWGLVPPWSKDPASGPGMINARSETASSKPSFRSALRRRRCLVAADGFYEWQRSDGRKQPFYVCLRGGGPFALAGLWERWKPPGGGKPLESCTLLTTEANELLAPVHDRMPVILPVDEYDVWLDPAIESAEPLGQLLRPYPSEEMKVYPVSTRVNNPRNDEPTCIEPAG